MCDATLQDIVNELYPMIIDYSEHTKAGTVVDITNFSTDLIHPSCDAKKSGSGGLTSAAGGATKMASKVLK